MMGLVVVSAIADEGGPLAYAKDFLINRNVLLASLTAVNKGDAAYVQIFDTPRKLAVAITDTNNDPGSITAPAHGFVTGDRVTFTGIAGLTSGYVRVQDADTLYAYATRAEALNPDTGATEPLLPTTDNDTGTLDLASNLTSPPVFEEYPLAAAGGAPSNIISFTAARFRRGLYVRAVTTQNGSTAIATDDVKFTPRYNSGDLAGPAYED